MEGIVAEDKYQKLASEYAKLRAQASVLRKGLLEEQIKSSNLRDQLKQKETEARRSEQEIDSLGFRNKQLELRVAALQEELATSEARKKDKKRHLTEKNETQQINVPGVANADMSQDALIFEELQKKIIENAELTSMIDDKERSLQLHAEHIKNIEETMEKRNVEHAENEKRLRKDMEMLQCRNQELETKLVEAASMLGSEDALSASGSENTPLHNHQNSHQVNVESRIQSLEQEVAHWRSQYELSKLYADSIHTNDTKSNASKESKINSSCSSTITAAGLTVIPSFSDGKSKRDSGKENQTIPCSKELLIFNNLSKKLEQLLKDRAMAESKVSSMETEVDHLQGCLENATQELKNKDEQIESINQALHLLEEDLTTTRVNYDEQISVLTEQVISLSEQLAASK
ncbi:protein phosphatase 1 regulatory subunit 21 [Stomoxys calcitrans]|uniref:Protein phosphatase 1 regulatory subunit 21 N-terminal domain-containing protein n=1 Tax=Stomoxys calcitrans TaxID=35570 RepID=A0A1I8NWR7_STOCA|nr:protein phosphatase 1 regulatory subunit 21 [Stomoxys calcitrans]